MQIQALSEEVINQIAAGEVVERPAHLVKELVENSLDAGATEVTVDIAQGGRSVRVQDNGSGIHSKEIATALQRFTTSKIGAAEDLWALKTFGFRGEALASISAVCKLRLVSRTEKSKSATRVEADFGQISKPEEVSGAVGTEISISELFENVPARLKFLKSGASEIGAIKNALKGLALAHHQVSFRLRVESELSFFYPAVKTRKSRVEQVFETKGLLSGVAEDGGTRVEALFASPEVTMKTSKGMWFFAQNRWIQDRTLQAAVMESFRTTLMHGEYPIAVVWVEVPTDEIDVNIHPTKSQVKFLHQSKLFRLVGAAIRPQLESYQSSKRFVSVEDLGSAPQSFPMFESERTQYQRKNFDPAPLAALGTSGLTSSQASSLALDAAPGVERFEGPEKNLAREDAARGETAPRARGPWSQLQIIGQSHLTYLITQSRDQLVIVDQHAAHERVLFETIMQGWREGKIDRQELLFPLSVDLGADKIEALLSVRQDFEKLGLRIESLGPSTLGISSIPAMVKESSLPPILDRIGTEILEQGGSFTFERKVSDLAATMACHSAIRAGQALSHQEMLSLLESMDQFSFSSFCPHGRPVSISKSLMDIEKDFGRRNA